MGFLIIFRTLVLSALWTCVVGLTPLSAVGDDNDCALYLSGPGRTSAYDYSLNLLKGNFGYEGQHTCITYDAVNRAYLEARNRIVVAQPKGDWKPEDYASAGELVLDISINLARTYGLTYEEIEKGLPLIDTSRTLIREVCPPVFSHVQCRAGKYRRLDGLCNNLQHPTWGATNAPFQRLIGPLFADGINSPRISHTGRDLPLSRVVSRTMHPDEGFHDHAGTVMVIAWGQFMDHDYTLTGTPLDPRNRNDPEECCKRPPHLKHPYCNEIRVPDDDYFYRLWGVKCIDFVRAFPSPRPGCRLGSRVPFNTLTGVLDGNTVYGVTDKFARKLRMGHGGLLRMNPVFKEYGLKDLLPLKLDIPDEGCTRPNNNMYCFEAGEIRVNEQLVLTVMHTLMAREHNRVARGLAAVNTHWDDETLYQEARRINIAEIQHITYNEFLPILLGKDVMEKFGLVLEKEGYWDGYDRAVNPDVIASFASAAYRFGHSLLPTAVERWSKAHKFIASKRLSDLIRRPFDLYRAGVLDEYVMGLMNQVAQAMDDSITQEVTNHLFKKVGARFGMDLVSFNMQRGREFGIPGYMEFRKFCGLPGADTFQDLFGTMSNETVHRYESIFEHPIDVDLWSGGVSERPLPGSMLGPTFACIIATQFSYSRRGDRFWFELPNQPSSFTPEQLGEVRKARLARIICDNTDIIDTVQLYPFVLPDHELNPRVPCRSGIIPSMDFSKWAEPVPFHQGAKHFITDAIVSKNNEVNCEYGSGDKETNLTNTLCGCSHTSDVGESPVQLNNGVNSNNIEEDYVVNPQDKSVPCTQTQAETIQGKTQNALADTRNSQLTFNATFHSTNVVSRTKRSNLVHSTLRYADNVPLLRYRVPDKPKDSAISKEATNIVNTAALADFHIETLHAPGAAQPSNSPQMFGNPPEYQKDNKSPASAEVSNESGDYLAKTISKPILAVPESEERVKDDNKLNDDKEVNDGESFNIRVLDDINERKNNNYEGSEERDKPNEKIFRTTIDESIEKGDSGEASSEVSDEISDEDDENDDYQKRKESGTPRSEKYNDEEDADPKEKESKELFIARADDSERIYKDKSKIDGPYRKRNQTKKKLYQNSSNINKQSSRQKDSQDNYENKRYHKKPYQETIERNKKENYKANKRTRQQDIEESEESDSNENLREESGESDPVLITEDSREDAGDDVPEHRSLPDDSGEDDTSSENDDRDNNQSEEADYPQQPHTDDKENYINDRRLHRKDNSESDEEETSRKPKTSWYPHNQNPHNQNNLKPNRYNDSSRNGKLISESSENEDESEEAIIIVMNKNRKNKLKNTNDKYLATSKNHPMQKRLDDIRDVDLRDFGHEQIKINAKGEVEPISHKKHETKQNIIFSPKRYNDGEIRPVVDVEIKREHEVAGRKNNNEPQTSDENVSLEDVLGVKVHNENESPENTNRETEDENRDLKQEFERIPVKNNINKPEQTAVVNEPAPETTTEYNIDETLTKLGLLKPIEPVRYDENLNIKFDDDPIVLPKINLPDDILTYANEGPDYNDPGYQGSHYHDPGYKEPKYQQVKKSNKQKDKSPNSQQESGEYDDSEPDGEESEENDDETSRDDDERGRRNGKTVDDKGQNTYYGYEGANQKINDIKQKAVAKDSSHEQQDGSNEEEDESNEEEEDLYEKFVRERFGKRGSFQKRSQNLLDGRSTESRPLFHKLHQVLKKTDDIKKEAAKSGDPNAGYMWTLEYGRPL